MVDKSILHPICKEFLISKKVDCTMYKLCAFLCAFVEHKSNMLKHNFINI